MIGRFAITLTLAVTLIAASVVGASAQATPALNLPPGIAKQAQPMLADMMAHMEQMGMSSEQIQLMMADMQTMADQLPPGIFLQLLRLMSQLDMSTMMTLHQQMHEGTLLQQPPGQILRYVRQLAA